MIRPADPAHFEPTGRFPTTRWSRVAAAAGPDARNALAELCVAYRFPVYAFIRRRGHGPDDALDLTQDYFARLLEKGTVAAADPTRGRFRSFLLKDCSFFLDALRKRDRALKRGGGRVVLPIDIHDTEGRLIHEPVHDQTPEQLFEREWALTLIARAFDLLQRHYADTGRAELFRRLKPLVSAEYGAASCAAVAAELGMTEGAVRVAVHRMRARFAAALRDEVAATLDTPDPGDVDEELRGLIGVLGS
jgi:RNA polymerase sigma-70 factor (ECF subfamily)